jgi:hypothetical protein
MDGLWFVAAFIVCVLVGAAIVWRLEVRDARHVARRPVTFAYFAERQIVTWTRPVLYDWDERGDFS